LSFGIAIDFMIVWFIVVILLYSPPMMWWFSIEYRMEWGWSVVLLFFGLVTAFINILPGIGGEFVNWARVFLPLILLVVDMAYTKIFERTFAKWQDNYNAQVMYASVYIYSMEFTRFSCFLSLYMDYKDGNVSIWDVLFNSLFSIVSEIWIHSGIHEPVAQYLDNRFGFLSLGYKFPKLRECFNAIRAIMEWVVPTVQLVGIYLIDWSRDYINVNTDDLLSELYFFTSYRIIDSIWESLLVYYSVEVVSKIICWLTAVMIDYDQLSCISILSWSSIFSWCVGIVLLEDILFSSFFWSMPHNN